MEGTDRSAARDAAAGSCQFVFRRRRAWRRVAGRVLRIACLLAFARLGGDGPLAFAFAALPFDDPFTSLARSESRGGHSFQFQPFPSGNSLKPAPAPRATRAMRLAFAALPAYPLTTLLAHFSTQEKKPPEPENKGQYETPDPFQSISQVRTSGARQAR